VGGPIKRRLNFFKTRKDEKWKIRCKAQANRVHIGKCLNKYTIWNHNLSAPHQIDEGVCATILSVQGKDERTKCGPAVHHIEETTRASGNRRFYI
jgi:hypothetical protein